MDSESVREQSVNFEGVKDGLLELFRVYLSNCTESAKYDAEAESEYQEKFTEYSNAAKESFESFKQIFNKLNETDKKICIEEIEAEVDIQESMKVKESKSKEEVESLRLYLESFIEGLWV